MERVRRFREEHPPKRAEIHGQEWEYIASGRGERALPEADEFRAYTLEVADRATKQGLIALYRRAADFLGNPRLRPEDLDAWPGKILLLMSDDDPVTPEPAREAMKAMYPRAEVHVFSGGGHATALLQPERYFGVMDRFLAG